VNECCGLNIHRREVGGNSFDRGSPSVLLILLTRARPVFYNVNIRFAADGPAG
jgi:hypothetical protein